MKYDELSQKEKQLVAEYEDDCGWSYELTYTCDEKLKTARFVQFEKNLKRKRKCAVQDSLVGMNR